MIVPAAPLAGFNYECGPKRRMCTISYTTSRESVSIVLTPDGYVHIYADGVHVNKRATGLPLNLPLYGAVDICDNYNIQVKSEILSKCYILKYLLRILHGKISYMYYTVQSQSNGHSGDRPPVHCRELSLSWRLCRNIIFKNAT